MSQGFSHYLLRDEGHGDYLDYLDIYNNYKLI